MIQRNDSVNQNRQTPDSSPTDSGLSSQRREVAKNKRSTRRRRRRLLMEGLETRQLLNAAPVAPPTVDPNLFAPQTPRNIGTVQAFQYLEQESLASPNSNDFVLSGEFLPLGTGSGQQDTIDVTGSMAVSQSSQGNFSTDVDTYAFDLRAGDILDLAVLGAGANLTTFYGNGQIWFGTDVNAATGAYPDGSPLMDLGNAVGAQVVPQDGRYYVQVAPSFTASDYTLGLRVYRPVLEQAPIGGQQIIFLDLDGGTYPTSDFPGFGLPLGNVRFFGLEANLDILGYTDPNVPDDYNKIVDYMIAEIEQQMHTIATNGTNGDFDATGIPGQYGVTVLNSRDHADPGNHPLVTRVVFGSDAELQTNGLFGIAQSIDVGNFRPNEKVLIGFEAHVALGPSYPRSPAFSAGDAIAQQLASTTTHEVGHSFGIFHTDGNNTVNNLMDEGSQSLDDFAQGIGNDGIFGTADDDVPSFNDDRFSVGEGTYVGIERVPASLSHVLSTGTAGTTISGTTFVDTNRDGVFFAESGKPSVTVFADVNGNGILDVTDPSTVSDGAGNYVLSVPPGAFNVTTILPTQFATTTAVSVPVNTGAGSAVAGVNFGFAQVIPDVTGFKFADTNGNGIYDTNVESGLEGFYIYLDLDGDDRLDLGEPFDISGPDGSYTINFPGPGTYTIREVNEPGFIQTFPAGGEHIVSYNGFALGNNFNFGNLPSRDYGDAPDSYQTSVAAGGPSHGLDLGIGLGAEVDREVDGFPSINALGDDNNNIDDEDGIQLLSPLGPGGTATLQVTTRNTTGAGAFFQGWLDFNGNGVFDASEKIFSDVSLGAGVSTLQVSVPADAAIGTTYARFRYSPTPGLGVGGEADSGEVEDYQFDILQAAQIANDDEFNVARNSLSNQLDVLANDFQTSVTQLTIVGLNVNGTSGTPVIASDGKSIFYTPQNGFIGRDVFEYVVRDQLNNTFTAQVQVNVNFRSNVPIAIDDTFEVPQGSSNRALNVLDNDIASIAGGLVITSVTAGDQGGQVIIEGGGQTIRYTPQPGFAGTEQFFYSIQDADGATSTAQVTVNSIPGARNDDLLDFTIGVFDVINDQPISAIQVGSPFKVKVFVEELNNPLFSPEGVASAFLDLLYTDELVSTQDTINSPFGFDIVFGPNFQGGFQLGNAQTPGLIDDVGSVQPIPGDGQLIQHSDPAELFTITMNAISPGVAVFAADPADSPIAESILVGEDVALTPAELRLGRTELTIFPAGDNFASAIDDAFVNGTDSDGVVISVGNSPNRLDVLANDIFGPTGTIQEFFVNTGISSLGTATVNHNGTPNDFNDDFIDYSANVGASGFDSFTYTIVSGDGVVSVAEVTLAIGGASGDDLVELSFRTVDQLGNEITSIQSGQTFGVEIYAEDLRPELQGNTYVFAAYQDILYDADLLTPGAVPPGGRYDFDVEFDSDFDAAAGVGTAQRDGIIDEFGSLLLEAVASGGGVSEPNLMATIFFVADSVTSPTQTTIIGSPADASPFQDTLLFDRDDPVEVSQITYNSISITVNPAGPQQNVALPEDVNDDGLITPSDALTVINALQRGGEGESGRLVFVDVNGDSIVSPIDALAVINKLARMTEGEALEGEMVDTSVSSPASDFIASADGDDDDDDVLQLLADDQASLS